MTEFSAKGQVQWNPPAHEMSIRDRIALDVLTAVYHGCVGARKAFDMSEERAKGAYEQADAMLAARRKPIAKSN